MNDLVIVVQDLACQFGKYHYDEYLKNNRLALIPEHEISQVVDTMYNAEKKNELKQFIRLALKEMCKENYNSGAVETILLEMCADDSMVKSRVCTEIEIFQRNNNE